MVICQVKGGRHSICIGDQAAGGTVNAALSGESQWQLVIKLQMQEQVYKV